MSDNDRSISVVMKGDAPIRAFSSEARAAEWAEDNYPDESAIYPDVQYERPDGGVHSDLTQADVEQLRDAFWDGQFVDVIEENEGSTRTMLFEVPGGHVGVTLGAIAARGEVYIGLDKWWKAPHHELDEWVWVRSEGDT